MTDNDDIIHHAFHHYCIFQVDNLSVRFIIDKLTMVKYTYYWIKIFQHKSNRRAELNDLCDNYNGPPKVDSSVDVAWFDVSKAFHKIESTFH